MNYFSDFFEKTTTTNGHEIINLTRSINVSNFINDDVVVDYDVKDGETPEILSNILYGSTDYWWIFFLVNDFVDPFYDWALSNKELKDYYSYLIAKGELVDSTANWNILVSENNAKRSIKVISQEYSDEFIFNVQKLIKNIV